MTASIPASSIVNVTPGVLTAGGSTLALSGLFLTNGNRVPVGAVLSFPTAPAVASYFGATSAEATAAGIYFGGFTNSTVKPGNLMFAQYNTSAVPAWLRGGSVAAMTLAQLQALSGTLQVVVEGVLKSSGNINLSGATSFSNAAALIQSSFGAFDGVTAATSTITAAPATSVTAGITGSVMTVSGIGSGTLVAGGVLSGTNVASGTQIVNQLTGTAGGVGTYTVSPPQNVAANTNITQSAGLLTVGGMASGTLAVGQAISGTGVAVGTTITALGSGTGGIGTYYTSGGAQTVSATAISAGPLLVTFDSVSNAFIFTGGTPGVAGTIGYATGTLSASLLLTQLTGAILSQGAPVQAPASFMPTVEAITDKYGSFMTLFDPDNGFGYTQKALFSSWLAAQDANDHVYVAWDTDISPTLSPNAPSDFGSAIASNGWGGTELIWDTDYTTAAFICGAIASIDFTRRNGRISFAYKANPNLAVKVTSDLVRSNLEANGYNYYGQWATADQPFIGYATGTVSGPFAWLDSYVNQIWLNNSFQDDLMNLLFNVNSIPYNAAGYALVHAACMDTINAGLNFGAFAGGAILSAAQIAEVNNAAGTKIDDVIASQGWYLQIVPATAAIRAQRKSPQMTFWYLDVGSIQKINLASIEVE